MLNLDFKNKVVIITGSSRGIGKGIAKAFAEAGARVALNYQSNEQAANEVLQGLGGSPHRLYRFDVSNTEAVEEAFSQIQNELGNPEILINNAGITRDQILLRLKPEDWDAVIQTNLRSVYACSKAAVKVMLKNKIEGSVINISSVIGQMGNSGQSNYAASKAGIIAFTKSVAQEVASRQIRLNCIAPGFIASDMTNSLSIDQKSKILELIPLGRMGEPADIAAACLFLASPYARYITGQTLNVDGGMFMH